MFFGYLIIFEISKDYNSKTINAGTKTRTDLESALNSAQSYEIKFSIFVLLLLFEDLPAEIYFFSQKYWFFELWPTIKKNVG